MVIEMNERKLGIIISEARQVVLSFVSNSIIVINK